MCYVVITDVIGTIRYLEFQNKEDKLTLKHRKLFVEDKGRKGEGVRDH